MIACPEILQRIADGNEQAFASLYNDFREKLLRFSYSITRSKQSAEEIVEDIFINIWCKRQDLPEIKNISVYLYTAVKNRSLNVLSKKTYDIITAPYDFLHIEFQRFGNTPFDLLVTREMMQQMNAAVEALPARCKMIFKLVREDGLAYKEVAEILNISAKTVDAQMAIAVKKICSSIEISRNKHSYIEVKKFF